MNNTSSTPSAPTHWPDTGQQQFIDINGLRYSVRQWGPDDAPPLVLLHGWMDCAATFAYLVQHLKQEWRVIAPDWRGFGESQWQHVGYRFIDYLADLDVLLKKLCPEQTISLVGHSLGGNIANLYAGTRPERIRHLISLEGFGLHDIPATQMPTRLLKWLDEHERDFRWRNYDSFAALAKRLQHNNQHLDADMALFMAHHWAVEEDGRVHMRADPLHRKYSPKPYTLEQCQAFWRRITCPTLWVDGETSGFPKWSEPEVQNERIACFNNINCKTIAAAGHMLHHDQPGAVAELIEQFCDQH